MEGFRPESRVCRLCLRRVASFFWMAPENEGGAPVCGVCASKLPSCEVYTPGEWEWIRGTGEGTAMRVPAPPVRKLAEAGFAPGGEAPPGEKGAAPSPPTGGETPRCPTPDERGGLLEFFRCPACGKYLRSRRRARGFVCKNRRCVNFWVHGKGPVFRMGPDGKLRKEEGPPEEPPRVGWSPFRCPECGWYLQYRKRAHGYVCKNWKCPNYWKLGSGPVFRPWPQKPGEAGGGGEGK